jgi:DNA-binding PadR family transcriptional regulator
MVIKMRWPTDDEMRVLRLLAGGEELCGVEMERRDPELVGGGIYVVLSRMEKKGFVRSRWQEVAGVRGRGLKMVVMTDFGRRCFRSAIAANVIGTSGDDVTIVIGGKEVVV